MSLLGFNNTAGYQTGAQRVNIANITKMFIIHANANAEQLRQRRIQEGLRAVHDLRNKKQQSTAKKVVNDYSEWTKSELRQSLVARGIKSEARCHKMYVFSLPSQSNPRHWQSPRDKDALVAALQQADKHAKFSRFNDLPPELRNWICKLVIEDSNPEGKARACPHVPAICRTNKQLRKESLTLFARSTCFSVTAGRSCETTFAHLQFRLPSHITPEVTLMQFKEYITGAEKHGWLQHMRSFQCELAGRADILSSGMVRPWSRRINVQFSKDLKIVKTRASQADQSNQGHHEIIHAKLAKYCAGKSTTMTGEVMHAMITIFDAYVRNINKGKPLDEEFFSV